MWHMSLTLTSAGRNHCSVQHAEYTTDTCQVQSSQGTPFWRSATRQRRCARGSLLPLKHRRHLDVQSPISVTITKLATVKRPWQSRSWPQLVGSVLNHLAIGVHRSWHLTAHTPLMAWMILVFLCWTHASLRSSLRTSWQAGSSSCSLSASDSAKSSPLVDVSDSVVTSSISSVMTRAGPSATCGSSFTSACDNPGAWAVPGAGAGFIGILKVPGVFGWKIGAAGSEGFPWGKKPALSPSGRNWSSRMSLITAPRARTGSTIKSVA